MRDTVQSLQTSDCCEADLALMKHHSQEGAPKVNFLAAIMNDLLPLKDSI